MKERCSRNFLKYTNVASFEWNYPKRSPLPHGFKQLHQEQQSGSVDFLWILHDALVHVPQRSLQSSWNCGLSILLDFISFYIHTLFHVLFKLEIISTLLHLQFLLPKIIIRNFHSAVMWLVFLMKFIIFI